MHTKQPVVARPVGMTGIPQCSEQLDKQSPIAVFQHALFRTHAKNNFLPAAKGDGLCAHARPRKLEPPPAKGKLGWRQHRNFTVLQNGLNAGDRFIESVERCRFIRSVHQPGRDVAAIAAIHLDDRIVPLVKLEQPPFGRSPIQVRHALAGQ